MKFTYAIISVAVCATSTQVSASDVGEIACNEFKGELVDFVATDYDNNFVGLTTTYCRTKFGYDDEEANYMHLDTSKGLNSPSMAATVLRTVPLLNFPKLMKEHKGEPMSKILCSELGGSYINFYSNFYTLADEDDLNVPFCFFGDGSSAHQWDLAYSSFAPIFSFENQFTIARASVPESMTYPQEIPYNRNGKFIDSVQATECKEDHECNRVQYDPCTGQKLTSHRMKCGTQGICVSSTPTSCVTDTDCEDVLTFRRNYWVKNQGFCVPSECTDGYCVALGGYGDDPEVTLEKYFGKGKKN